MLKADTLTIDRHRVKTGRLDGRVHISLQPLGPTEDWQGLTDQLLELTQGAAR